MRGLPSSLLSETRFIKYELRGPGVVGMIRHARSFIATGIMPSVSSAGLTNAASSTMPTSKSKPRIFYKKMNTVSQRKKREFFFLSEIDRKMMMTAVVRAFLHRKKVSFSPP